MENEEKIDNKKAILRNALNLFSKKQYEAVGIQEVVDLSGITKPTLYYHFGNKIGLFEGVIREYGKNLIERLSDIESHNEDLTGSLKRVAEIYFDLIRENSNFAKMFLNFNLIPEDSEIRVIAFGFYMEAFSYVEDIFKKEENKNGNMKNRSKIYCTTFMGMIFTYMSMIFNGFVEISDKLIFDAVRQFLYGIYS